MVRAAARSPALHVKSSSAAHMSDEGAIEQEQVELEHDESSSEYHAEEPVVPSCMMRASTCPYRSNVTQPA